MSLGAVSMTSASKTFSTFLADQGRVGEKEIKVGMSPHMLGFEFNQTSTSLIPELDPTDFRGLRLHFSPLIPIIPNQPQIPHLQNAEYYRM